MQKSFLILVFLIPFFSFAQLNDDFEDADITNWTERTVARWAASDISPLSGIYSLHHVFDNPDAGKDQISFDLLSLDLNADSTIWRFKIKYNYNPSDGNNWSVFLVSDADAINMIPGGTVNGYALGVNFTGSDDILKLLKIESGSATTIIETSLNWDTGTNPSDTVALEIIRTKTAQWEVFYNLSGDFDNLNSIGTGIDNAFFYSEYFGIYYDYTSSADRLLWIDDIEIIGEIYIDDEAPLVDTIDIISASHLNVVFNETLDSLLAVDELNYSIDGGVGNPDSVSIDLNKKAVQLYLSQNLLNKKYYNIEIQNIEDVAGNVINDTSINFLYYIPQGFDLVINEIMADPTPAINLPEHEYIEIKNASEFDINVKGWKLKTGTTIKDFPDHIIDSGAYTILCSSSAVDALDNCGEVIEFSSLSITNTGTSIAILDSSNNLIDSINFTKDWYQDVQKQEGGWSLERIDPLNTCSTLSNWKASIDSNGGTPGVENSIFAPNIDSEAPQLFRLDILSDTTLKLIFNEPVIEINLSETTNYSIDNAIGNPISVLSSDNFTEVELVFSIPFPQETDLNLSITNMIDDCGNVNSLIEYDFLYYKAQPYDVVINEVMVKPEPVLGLPAFEYIELFNTSAYDLSLNDWTLSAGSSIKSLGSDTIAMGEYLILCHEEAIPFLQQYGKVVGFSSFSLTDVGLSLVLKNSEGTIVSNNSYSDEWYRDEFKAEGGWSLEQIDPLNPCGGEYNWIASVSEIGGTPGTINSVNESNPDLESPELQRITVIDNSTIQLFFNESLDSVSVMQTNNYNVDNGIGNPIQVKLVYPDYKTVLLAFDDVFEPGIIYYMEITGGITDCSGNEINEYSFAQFAVPYLPIEYDLVINEILFNPLPNGFDFVELYNRSEKTIDLKDVLIASYDEDLLEISSVRSITTEGFLVFPGDYVVITENPRIVQNQYMTNNSESFIQVKDLPSYNDDQGRVFLMDKWQTIIDHLSYEDKMHFDLLATTEGVSLERINYDRETDDKTNWHSASELVGFATPGYENSQFKELQDFDDLVIIDPEIFSPDNDGFEDFTNISFTLDEPGYVANIKIYDSKGRLIRYLSNNQLLGIDGIITWDGLDDRDQKAPVGIYVIFIEIFDLNGIVKQYKKSVVLAAKW